ncbi:uncharacterized protein EAF01_000597 [Botrytis porri]|uniref:uncharacterized protein n=1 Tax=Botrytis porri TaxID=87229 RepID=UPI0019014C03|nr:uncharacterized protein EAF01_000597 [Botrytis porri]KAF7914191.1 hypothetical protein EAF01_000597 [Botrytis porri]
MEFGEKPCARGKHLFGVFPGLFSLCDLLRPAHKTSVCRKWEPPKTPGKRKTPEKEEWEWEWEKDD